MKWKLLINIKLKFFFYEKTKVFLKSNEVCAIISSFHFLHLLHWDHALLDFILVNIIFIHCLWCLFVISNFLIEHLIFTFVLINPWFSTFLAICEIFWDDFKFGFIFWMRFLYFHEHLWEHSLSLIVLLFFGESNSFIHSLSCFDSEIVKLNNIVDFGVSCDLFVGSE